MMLRPSLALLTALAAAAPAAAAGDRATKTVPAMRRLPAIDGDTAKEFARALALPKVEGANAAFTTRVGYRSTVLYLAVEVTDDSLTAGDALELMLHFPNAGTTAEGHRLRFAYDGKRMAEGEYAAPPFAQERATAAVQKSDGGMTLEIALPAEALPRFPAFEPMVFDLCLTYEDRDAVGSPAALLTNCKGASMGKEALRLPDEFRKRLGLKPSREVVGIQRRARGWIGYGILHYPIWAYADAPLTYENLQALVADDPMDPESAGVNLPERLQPVRGVTLLSVLSGRNPYAVEGRCNSDHELRIGLYLVKGRTADRVLEWPGATCALGRAVSVVLEDDGSLTIGYSNGATVEFAWTGGRFQRTEIGLR